MKNSWITVIGIGCDGLDGLSAQSREVLASAEVLAGSARYHTLVSDTDILDGCVRLISQKGFTSLAEQFQSYKDKRIVVMTAGDPMHYGAGSALARRLGTSDITVIPKPSAFSLACGRMVWSVPDSECLTIHASHPAGINLYVYPGAKIVALGADGETPTQVASYLCERGFAQSHMTVFCDMGDMREQCYKATAESWSHGRVSDLNTICVECIAGPDARWWSRVPGLPADAFVSGGELISREARTNVLSVLAPQPGDTLWGIGDNSGAIAIEWLRSTNHTRATVYLCDEDHRTNLEKNAEFLGVPHLRVQDDEDFENQREPHAIFLSGSLVSESKLRVYHDLLVPGGRLVTVCNEHEVENLAGLLDSLSGTCVEMRIDDHSMFVVSFKSNL
ncbi:MAG: precorrin-6y C5,15-methyltransferase (decarboxylating) subunit CbiE [Rhodospirillales bacterium]|jgi:precorrin-6B C5,15-methyltransferase / cobalt-precorrin-6B C5,C15-methyltransferase|nr:precorrin-6y C5,15-methyltransferase (decarboxylating) subunit CbiE [Rhodospirillales bacterium]